MDTVCPEDYSILYLAFCDVEAGRQAKERAGDAEVLASSAQGDLAHRAAAIARLERRINLMQKEKEGLLKIIGSHEADSSSTG